MKAPTPPGLRRALDGPAPLGFVLAGGRSSRFGAEKARHRVDGEPMALRVAAAMRRAGATPILVARDGRLEDLGAPVLIEDAEGPHHPLNGVVAALALCAREGLPRALFSPCDLPWICAEAFSALLEGPPGPRVAWGGERLHPLVARYESGALGRARALLSSGAPARALAEGAARIALPEGWLRNVNRLSDLP